MTPRAAKVLSRGIVTACVLMIAVDVVLLASLQRHGTPTEVVVVGDLGAPGMAEALDELEERIAQGDVSAETPVGGAIFGMVGLVWAVTGSLIVSRQPRNRAGWIFCIVGAAVPVNGLAFAYVLFTFRLAGGSLPGVEVAAILGEYSFAAVALVPLLLLLFPDGRPPSPRWAWASRLLVLGFVLAVGAFVLQPGPLNNLVDSAILYENPIGIEPFADGEPGSLLIPIGALLLLGTSLATVIAVRQRFRRAVGEERQQMRWLVAVATASGAALALMLVMTPIALLLGFATEASGPIFDVLWLLGAISVFLGIPGAYLVAIFRYRLWELDVVIRKAVVAALVVATLTAVGVLVLIAIPILVVGIRPDASAIPVLVGVVLGMLVGPIRRRARRLADRLVFGKRATPYEVLSEFSERVAGTYATEDVLPRMARILADGTGARTATVWLRIGAELRPEAVVGERDQRPVRLAGDGLPALPDEHAVEVRDRGELLGVLSVTMPASDPMDPAKEKLVRGLASQAGLVLRNVKLIEELRASRQRLVTAQDEERRRIERNIHDGAQQQLVALSVKAGLARRLTERDPRAAADALEQIEQELRTALEDLRDLARGIYPPLLADRGLAEALEAQARRSPVPVTVESDHLGRYPREVESAVYFSALEALNNVAKYSEASHATIRLEAGEAELRFEVSDDGIGFDPRTTGYGTGVQGMVDRVEAVGGALRIESSPGSGTTVSGAIPVPTREVER
jgi:signal transduction histidine kinase